MFKNNQGQSILEYVIILIAIVGCIAYAATAFIANGSVAAPKGVGKLMQDTGTAINCATGALGNISQ